MARIHTYRPQIQWTGNRGAGTASYEAYGRDHLIGKSSADPVAGSADPAFRGDPGKYSPEDLFVSAFSTCHMLWYLHLCAEAGVVVTAYQDQPEGRMEETAGGDGCFTAITLHPVVSVRDASMVDTAYRLHEAAHVRCFIARSANFPVHCQPSCVVP